MSDAETKTPLQQLKPNDNTSCSRKSRIEQVRACGSVRQSASRPSFSLLCPFSLQSWAFPLPCTQLKDLPCPFPAFQPIGLTHLYPFLCPFFKSPHVIFPHVPFCSQSKWPISLTELCVNMKGDIASHQANPSLYPSPLICAELLERERQGFLSFCAELQQK